ncbi:hypothetical protein Tco_0293138, partial [Tanacetum coccineum]
HPIITIPLLPDFGGVILPLSVAITPDLPITDSLIMEVGHLNTILETESDEENESSVEDLNLTPSESKDLSDIESECDMPFYDDFTTFSNPLFDSTNDFTSSDDESLSDEDVPEENFKIIGTFFLMKKSFLLR